jgi:hypothetical protein
MFVNSKGRIRRRWITLLMLPLFLTSLSALNNDKGIGVVVVVSSKLRRIVQKLGPSLASPFSWDGPNNAISNEFPISLSSRCYNYSNGKIHHKTIGNWQLMMRR